MQTFKEYFEESLNSIQYTIYKELDPDLAVRNHTLFNILLNSLIESEGANIRELVYAVENKHISLEKAKRIIKFWWDKIKRKHEHI